MAKSDIIDEIRKELFSMQDKEYGMFQGKLIKTVEPKFIIGVRTPQLRKFAKELAKEENIGLFLEELPHAYFEENQLHAFILSLEKNFEECISKTEEFLPFIDNWATCDQFSPKAFKNHTDELLPYVERWIMSGKTYTVRFAIGMLMRFYLDEKFKVEYADKVANVRLDEYYVKMMVAWYFATALAKQYEMILPFIEGRSLPAWTHNKAIQKAIESYRITSEQKSHLRTLKACL